MKLFKALGLIGLSQQAPVEQQPSADSHRVDCHPENDATSASCEARGCLWAPGERGAPWCYYPKDYKHYRQVGEAVDTVLEQDGRNVQAKIFNLERDPEAKFIPEYITQVQNLQVQVTYQCNEAVRIKIVDADAQRYEVPVPINRPLEEASWLDKDGNPSQTYYVETNASPFWIKVRRRSGKDPQEDDEVVFDTSAGPILYYNQFLQLTTFRPTEYIYGFGETEHLTFKYDTNWSQQGMWARDNGVGVGSNLYGVQPYHIAMEESGKASGILFFNSNAQEVAVSPHPHVTYRTIGGVLDFFVFMGPSVEDVTQEYTQYLGRSPMFPYWSLGFQLCRYGYNSLDEVKRVVEENRAAGIPYDVQYGDIDYMERQLDFTIEKGPNFDGLVDYVHKMRTEYNMRYIPILDPAISIDDQGEGAWKDPVTGQDYPTHAAAMEADVYIRGEDGQIETGKVWPYKPGIYLDDIVQDDQGWDENVGRFHSRVAFPDFFKNETYTWWLSEMERFRHALYPESYPVRGLEYDGIWIDMNEPASFTAGRPGPEGFTQGKNGCTRDPHHLNFPPYVPVSLNEAKNGVGLFEKTICMNSLQQNPLTGEDEYHYDVHSLYGYSEGEPTLKACEEVTGKRCIVVSRSTFPGVQKSIGHWLGDNTSMWRHVKQSLIGVMEFSLFGFAYTGPDTCGFFNDSNEELCKRWMQVGSFFTYSRNHNGITFRRQDPAAWGSQFAQGARATLLERYRLLPFLYTLTYRAHTRGDSVVRSMLSNFPKDKETWTIDEQMMWGNGLLIAPVLFEQTFVVNTYFPDNRWYSYYTGDEVQTRGGYQQINAPLDFIPLFLRGGEILPIQHPAVTTMDSRMNNLGLIVSLDDNNEATGELYWDEGDSIDPIENGKYTFMTFEYKNGHLRSNIEVAAVTSETHQNSGETVDLKFTHLTLNGLDDDVTRIIVNGQELSNQAWRQNRNRRLEIIDNEFSFKLPIGEQFDIFIEVNNESKRVDCMPGGGSKDDCVSKGCRWSSSKTAGVPWCYHTGSSFGLTSGNSDSENTMTGNELDIDLTNKATAGSYSDLIENSQFQIRRINSQQARFKLVDVDNNRWEIPDEALDYANEGGSQDSNEFDIVTGENANGGFYFSVVKDGNTLISSSHGPMLFEDQYVEVSLELGSFNCYGLGEHNHRRFRHVLNWQKWAMFTRDVAPIDEWNFYGQHPFIMCVNDDEVFGIYMHNSNAQEWVLSPNPGTVHNHF